MTPAHRHLSLEKEIRVIVGPRVAFAESICNLLQIRKLQMLSKRQTFAASRGDRLHNWPARLAARSSVEIANSWLNPFYHSLMFGFLSCWVYAGCTRFGPQILVKTREA